MVSKEDVVHVYILRKSPSPTPYQTLIKYTILEDFVGKDVQALREDAK